ncbi:MAG: hypothetical protein ABR614_07670 [Mycobacteriales bacterium]
MRCFDGEAGVALLDDGTDLPFAAAALDGLRLLHPGQRVQLTTEDGRVVRVALPGS